jgi:hypothetical protein
MMRMRQRPVELIKIQIAEGVNYTRVEVSTRSRS